MKKYLVCIFAVGLIGIFALTASAQQKQEAAPAAPAAQSPAPAAPAGDEAAQPKDLSIYGEVQSVNAASNTMSVQYYNYDTDEEKTINISTDKGTKIENVASLGDIKKGDWADVTYAVDGAKNVAKAIIVEKEEMPAEEAPAAAAAPEAAPGAEE